MAKTPTEIRWRLNDPAEENRVRWTKVHRTAPLINSGDQTACLLTIPEHPYMVDIDDQIPADAPRCKRCERSYY